ncbi:MAG: sigma-70 family RNA polymerase sigma factor [Byssovorax sp.]
MVPATQATKSAALGEELKRHERFLVGLCYRMLGSLADAEDVVQETFVRALSHPPARRDEPLRPWLLKVAMNLGRDALRRRKRRGYVGPWLPSPVEEEAEPPSVEVSGAQGTEGRYDLLESVSLAFLLALEALTPSQRAVFLLREVAEYSVTETAEALGMSEANVKTTHHRARKALDGYEEGKTRPSADVVARSSEALQRFLQGLSTGDGAAVISLLAPEAVALSDGGGEFLAARVVVRGAEKVAKMYLGLTQKHGRGETRYALRMLNGLPALVAERVAPKAGEAPRFVIQVEVDGSGRITMVYSVLATAKMRGWLASAPAAVAQDARG